MGTGSEPPETDSKKLLFETLETAHSQRVESTYLVDLRRHPRFDTQFPGIATAECGESVDVAITNISRSGLRLEGGQQMMATLFANFTHEVQPPTSLQVSFSVPRDSDYLTAVKVQCRTAFTRKDNDICQIGLEIVAFDDGGEAFTEYVLHREATGHSRSPEI